MNQRSEFLIGGGVGCTPPFELSGRGREVTVIERLDPGSESSTAAAGILGPQMEASGPGPLLDLKLAGKALFSETAERLRRETGIEVEYRPIVVLHLFFSEFEEAEARERPTWQEKRGLRGELLSARETLEMERCLSPGIRGALLHPDDHQGNNSKLVRALYQGARGRRAPFSQGNPVTEVLRERSRIRGVSTPCERREAEAAVVCTGSSSAELSRRCGLEILLSPARGQMFLTSAALTLLRKVISHRGCYQMPRISSRIVVGSTVEFADYDRRVTVAGRHDNRTGALTAVPSARRGIHPGDLGGAAPALRGRASLVRADPGCTASLPRHRPLPQRHPSRSNHGTHHGRDPDRRAPLVPSGPLQSGALLTASGPGRFGCHGEPLTLSEPVAGHAHSGKRTCGNAEKEGNGA